MNTNSCTSLQLGFWIFFSQLIVILLASTALGAPPQEATSTFDQMTDEIKHLQERLAQIEEDNGIIPDLGFRAHKPNYVLPLTWSTSQEGRLTQEIKFQFSLGQQVFAWKRLRFFYAYSQKSFFQVYDSDNSRPFRESNYNPEAFVRSPNFLIRNWGKWYFDFGYEHESNGQPVPLSRSWDRLSLRLKVIRGPYAIFYKGWYRLPEPKKRDDDDPAGDDNPDLEKYYGHGELGFEMDWKKIHLSTTGRYSLHEGKGGTELNLTFPAFGKIRGLIHYWNGYGESLMDYNRSISKIGIGFQFTQ